MQPPLAFADALTQLKLLTSQTANFTFTNDELTQALTTAWQDQFVVNSVFDETLNYSIGTWQYPIPSTLNSVNEIYIQRSTSDYPEKIGQDLYEIVNGNIQFHNRAQLFLSDNYQLLLKGKYKLSTDDTLDTDSQINYVLTNAAFILLRQLLLKAAFVFLRNDITVADIGRAKNDMFADMVRYRQALQREFQSV